MGGTSGGGGAAGAWSKAGEAAASGPARLPPPWPVAMELAGIRPGERVHLRLQPPMSWLPLLQLLLLLPGPAASQLRYSVPEEQAPGAPVGNVARALGLELRRLGPGCLRIHHLGAPSPRYLELDLTNGALFVNERIDREALCEQRPRCLLSLEVLAHSPVAVSAVEVEVLDINDNSPRFPRPDYQLQVSESVAPGARFHIESAQDPDVGTNSVQTYELSPNEHFELDLKPLQENSKVLELLLRKGLDREQAVLHHLVLTAVDGGSPARSGTAQISVRVLDTNDNSPAFDQSTYRVHLREDSPPGTPWDFPGKNTGVGSHFLLQRIFLAQGLNMCLLH